MKLLFTTTLLFVQAVFMALAGLLMVGQKPVLGQISTDRTVGTTVTIDNNVFTITDGTTEGTNLFHSFEEFSVPTNGSASFDNSVDISHIFGRVTGGARSDIDGLIKANGTANLYLVNPNGILFGPNATLEIGGDFVATGADGVVFENGYVFSANDTSVNPLLTVNLPIGLGFRDEVNYPGTVSSRANLTLE